MDLSKLTAQELKDLCRQLQSQIDTLSERLNKSWLTKLKEICGFIMLTSVLMSPALWGLITIANLLTNR